MSYLTGNFQASEGITDNSTPAGSATTAGVNTNYASGTNETKWYWQNDQVNVAGRFYNFHAKITIIQPGQYPDLQTGLMLGSTATVDPENYRIYSTGTVGYSPASGLYQILSVNALYNMTVPGMLDHYELELKEIP